MAFKLVVLFATLAVASAGLIDAPGHLAYTGGYATGFAPAEAYGAIGATQSNVVRSYGGTVSQYAKAVDTPFSSVRKQDTRITNNVYGTHLAAAPAYSALSYAAPAVSYAAAPAAVAYGHAAPALAYGHAAPALAYGHAAPALAYGHAAPALAYGHAAPALAYGHAAPAVAYGHAAPALSYAAAAPVATVSHVSFDGLGAHYAW